MRARVGHTIEDRCRPCKMDRRHTVVAVAADGTVLRVQCDTCASLHNYRGGASGAEPMPPVSEQEVAAVSPGPAPGVEVVEGEEVDVDPRVLEQMLRRVIREETGLTPVTPADKWRGGELVLKPGRTGLQEKSWPIETFFHKVVTLRNRLRVLEQQINGAEEIPLELKLRLQGYVTACYGTLTSFNVLFADEADRFRGAGGED